MLEFLNSLTSQAVIAVLGSLVTIIIGIFGYLRTKPNSPSSTTKHQREEIEALHARISSAKEAALENKGDLKVLTNLVKAIEKRMEDHERRDIEDFKVMQQKLDKTMDIVIQILQDDKL